MGLANKGMAIFFIVTAVWAKAVVGTGKVYKVGDSAGWTTIGNVDYNKWASSKTFHVGDTILFEYNTQVHNVMEVSHSDFRTCNVAAPIKTYTTGNDSITIKSAGHYFFLCSLLGHCQAGQKVDIRVLKTYRTKNKPKSSSISLAIGTNRTEPQPTNQQGCIYSQY